MELAEVGHKKAWDDVTAEGFDSPHASVAGDRGVSEGCLPAPFRSRPDKSK